MHVIISLTNEGQAGHLLDRTSVKKAPSFREQSPSLLWAGPKIRDYAEANANLDFNPLKTLKVFENKRTCCATCPRLSAWFVDCCATCPLDQTNTTNKSVLCSHSGSSFFVVCFMVGQRVAQRWRNVAQHVHWSRLENICPAMVG